MKTAPTNSTDPSDIISAVCARFDITAAQLLHRRQGQRVRRTIFAARMVAAWLLRSSLELSYPAIARTMGLKSHRDIIRMLQLLQAQPDLTTTATELWFELELRKTLQPEVAAFEEAVGLHFALPDRTSAAVPPRQLSLPFPD